jgi:hypothetical protein
MRSRRLLLAAACAVLACGVPKEDPTTPVSDVAHVPPLLAGGIEYRFPETLVEPGDEQMNCYFLEPTTEDMYLTSMSSFQGKFGHHLVIFKATSREPPGTMRSCDAPEDMTTLLPVFTNSVERLPDGLAVRVAKGTQMVLQQHYLNTSVRPIRTSDAMHVFQTPLSQVQHLAGFYGHSDISFVLKPTGKEVTLTFECAAPSDIKLIQMGPHMHEWGVRFKAFAGPKANPTPVIDVNPWTAEMRDQPPSKEFPVVNPFLLKAGDVVRTQCTFKNTTGADLRFPKEMCATFGYYFPAKAGEDWICGAPSTTTE